MKRTNINRIALGATLVSALWGGEAKALHDTNAVFAYVDMMTYELKFYEPTQDLEASVDLRSLPGYGEGVPLHAYITAEGTKVYVAYNGDATLPSGLAVIQVNDIFWHEHTADVEIVNNLVLDVPALPSSFPAVQQVTPLQPIQPWASQPFTQLHGPAEVPGTSLLYWTILTDDRVVSVDMDYDDALTVTSFGDHSAYLHGISFSPLGKKGLGAGYFYDRGFLPKYAVEASGELIDKGKIWLGTKNNHAAYVHNVEWLSERYAVVGTMQFGRTSLTSANAEILGPSIWLVDSKKGKSRQILGPTNDVNGSGVFRSASWVEYVDGKLFVGEEDSLDATFGEDGYVAVYDFSDPMHPCFIKRLRPGYELPADFNTGHGLVVTPDEESVILESYASGYILRIGVESLEVEYVIHHSSGGHSMPHGGSIVKVGDHDDGHEPHAFEDTLVP